MPTLLTSLRMPWTPSFPVLRHVHHVGTSARDHTTRVVRFFLAALGSSSIGAWTQSNPPSPVANALIRTWLLASGVVACKTESRTLM